MRVRALSVVVALLLASFVAGTARAQGPSAPQNVQADSNFANIVVWWDPPADNGSGEVETYWVYRSADGQSFDFHANVTPTVFSDEDLPGETTYWYYVVAVTSWGPGNASAVVSATTPPEGPATAPRDLTAEIVEGPSVSLMWLAPDSNGGFPLENYSVERAVGAGAFVDIANVSAWFHGYNDSDLAADTTYRYRVRALNAWGYGAYSDEANATTGSVPSAPLDLRAESAIHAIDLNWTSPAQGGANVSYRIFRGDSAENVTFLAAIGANTSYRDWQASSGALHFYRVSAVNAWGEGPKSNASANQTYAVPGVPRDFVAADGWPIGLSWLAPESDGGAPIESYEIRRGPSLHALEHLASVSGNTSFDDHMVAPCTSYYYSVAAVNVAGAGGSSWDVAMRPSTPLAPLDFVIGNSTDPTKLDLWWNAPASDCGSSVQNYWIHRSLSVGDEGELVGNVSGSTFNFTDAGLTPNTTYHYRLRAVNAYGPGAVAGPLTNATFGNASAPRSLSAVGDPNMINLTWQPPEIHAWTVQEYRIYRGNSSSETGLIAVVGASTLSYSDTVAPGGVVQFYHVSAVNAVGESELSNTANATRPVAPSAPRNLSATNQITKVKLEWSAPSFDGGAAISSYDIWRSVNGGAMTFRASTAGNDLDFDDTTCPIASVCAYEVSALNVAGEGPRSNRASSIG